MFQVTFLSLLLLTLAAWMVFSAYRVARQPFDELSSGIGPVLCLTGLFFLIWGTKLSLIHAFGSDLPLWDIWEMEGNLFPKVLAGAIEPSAWFGPHHNHRPFTTRLLFAMLFEINGQWDPFIDLVVSSFFYSFILTGFCAVLWKFAGGKDLPQLCIVLGIFGLLQYSWEITLWSAPLCFYFLLFFSFISIVLLLNSKPFSVKWCLGLLATLLNQVSIASGFLVPLAIACGLIFDCLSRPKGFKKAALPIIVLTGVAVLEFQLVSNPRPILITDLIRRLKVFGEAAAWPFPIWYLAPIVWSPFWMLLLHQFRSKRSSPLAQFLLTVGISTLVQVLAMAAERDAMAPRYRDIFAIGLSVHLIILFYFLNERFSFASRFLRGRAPIWVGAIALVFCTVTSLLHLRVSADLLKHLEDLPHSFNSIQEVNTSGYVLTGDRSLILGQPVNHLPFPDEEGLFKYLDDPVLRRILPAGIRPPLFLEEEKNSGFSPGGGPPDVPVLTNRKVLGAWLNGRGLAPSEYLSRPVSSSYRYIVMDISGGGPDTLLEILPEEGPAIPVDLSRVVNGWEKVIIRAPDGPFRLHASNRGEHSWIAFSFPRELASGGYYARRIASGNLIPILLGMISLFAGFSAVRKKPCNSEACLFT